jgi:hypothetical protein
LNVNLAKEKLGWELRYGNQKLVEKTIEWYLLQMNGESAEKITNDQINEYMFELYN